MNNQLTVTNEIESSVILGDLSKLSPEQRVNHYLAVCNSLGINPLTRPFDYINLSGKLVLYAKKDAADQLRDNKNISISKPDITFQDDMIIVTVGARDPEGREDWDIGVVNKKDMQGNIPNALMKAVTKAKRRVTLSICGLGWLDETEVETIRDAKPVIVTETGEIVDGTVQHDAPAPTMTLEEAKDMRTSRGAQLGTLSDDQLRIVLASKTADPKLQEAANLILAQMQAELI